MLEYREADLDRIESEEGIKLRMNQSIQVEGSFGELKQNSGFRRFLCRGSQNVKAEAILLAFAHNINKLHHKIQGDRTGNRLFPLKKSSKNRPFKRLRPCLVTGPGKVRPSKKATRNTSQISTKKLHIPLLKLPKALPPRETPPDLVLPL